MATVFYIYIRMALVKNITIPDEFLNISTAQRDEFRVNGHLLVRGVLGSERKRLFFVSSVLEAVKRQSREKTAVAGEGNLQVGLLVRW